MPTGLQKSNGIQMCAVTANLPASPMHIFAYKRTTNVLRRINLCASNVTPKPTGTWHILPWPFTCRGPTTCPESSYKAMYESLLASAHRRWNCNLRPAGACTLLERLVHPVSFKWQCHIPEPVSMPLFFATSQWARSRRTRVGQPCQRPNRHVQGRSYVFLWFSWPGAGKDCIDNALSKSKKLTL